MLAARVGAALPGSARSSTVISPLSSFSVALTVPGSCLRKPLCVRSGVTRSALELIVRPGAPRSGSPHRDGMLGAAELLAPPIPIVRLLCAKLILAARLGEARPKAGRCEGRLLSSSPSSLIGATDFAARASLRRLLTVREGALRDDCTMLILAALMGAERSENRRARAGGSSFVGDERSENRVSRAVVSSLIGVEREEKREEARAGGSSSLIDGTDCSANACLRIALTVRRGALL